MRALKLCDSQVYRHIICPSSPCHSLYPSHYTPPIMPLPIMPLPIMPLPIMPLPIMPLPLIPLLPTADSICWCGYCVFFAMKAKWCTKYCTQCRGLNSCVLLRLLAQSSDIAALDSQMLLQGPPSSMLMTVQVGMPEMWEL